jgi:hypothetical protein
MSWIFSDAFGSTAKYADVGKGLTPVHLGERHPIWRHIHREACRSTESTGAIAKQNTHIRRHDIGDYQIELAVPV